MKRAALLMILGTLLVTGCISVDVKDNKVESEQGRPAQVLRHVVLFKWKDGTPDSEVRKIENAFCALPGKIDSIYDFEWGTEVSAENLADGFTHCFLVTFRSEEGRSEYLPHPAHKDFVALIQPHLEKALVVDYWADN